MKEGFELIAISSVIVTWACAYIDGSAPYFPIEISRTACGPISRWPLRLGAILSFIFAQTIPETVACSGFLLLALVTDTMSWSVHSLGVVIMVLGALMQVYPYPSKLAALLAVGGLFAARVVAKALVVWWAELDGDLDFGRIAMATRQVMLVGNGSPETMVVMKLTGAMQWGCFLAVINLL